jgi:hypothetical protein
VSCGCAAVPRRRCDLCEEERFLACSAACLARHLRERHPGAGDAPARARAFQVEVNRAARGAYDGHRRRLTSLVQALQRGEGLCVLGAGNGDDLDLAALARDFRRVALVDIDGEALERAVGALPRQAAERVTTHVVDLTGALEHIDAWGERLPDDERWRALAQATSADIADRLGQFDVVLSACVLSQLCHPFQHALALAMPDWRRLFLGITRLHLATVARLTRAGGTGVIACDVLSHAGAALPTILAQIPRDRLEDVLEHALATGALKPDPDPRAVAALLTSDGHAERAQITQPWLWDLSATVQLVYAIFFQRN